MLPADISTTALLHAYERLLERHPVVEVLSPEQLEEFYCFLGHEELLPEDHSALQGLFDITRTHMKRFVEEASAPAPESRVGRPSRAIPAEKWKISIRQDLALFVDALLYNPMREKLSYGTRSQLIENLTLEWARKRGFKG